MNEDKKKEKSNMGRKPSENPEELANKRIATYITELEDNQLKSIAKQKGLSKSSMIRQAIKKYIEYNQ